MNYIEYEPDRFEELYRLVCRHQASSDASPVDNRGNWNGGRSVDGADSPINSKFDRAVVQQHRNRNRSSGNWIGKLMDSESGLTVKLNGSSAKVKVESNTGEYRIVPPTKEFEDKKQALYDMVEDGDGFTKEEIHDLVLTAYRAIQWKTAKRKI